MKIRHVAAAGVALAATAAIVPNAADAGSHRGPKVTYEITIENHTDAQPFSPVGAATLAAGGFFGPNLTGGSTLSQFETAIDQSAFITRGQAIGQTYGRGGSGGNGQMPGFGALTEANPVGPGMGPGSGIVFEYPALLTDEQIDAIVAFERTL